jgi:tripartite ATP-independent transporter DctP family solute receptor
MVGDLQSGKLDFAVPDTSVLSKFESGFSLLNLPYEFESEIEASRALDGRFGEQLAQSLERHGLIGLGYWENGFRHVTNSRQPLKAAADFRSLNIRVMQNPVFVDAFQSLGATTTPLPFTELFNAMKTGKVEAQENPPITILNEHFYEVQKYMTVTRHSYSAWLFMISKKTWDQLNADERKLLRETAIEARDYERKLIRQESRDAIEGLRAHGMQVLELPPVELSRVRLLIREKTAAHKAKIDPAWRNNLYMGRLDDILTKLDQPNGAPAPVVTNAPDKPSAAPAKKKSS